MKYVWFVSGIALLLLACKKEANKTEEPNPDNRVMEKTEQGMKIIQQKLVEAITSSDSNTIQEMMSPSILCCNEGEGPGACISYFFPHSSESNANYPSKLISVINSGYAVTVSENDSIARFPKFYPSQKDESGFVANTEDYASGYYEYIIKDSIMLYDTTSIHSNPRSIRGLRFVKRVERKDCKDYGILWDVDCDWQKIETPENETGWVRGEGLLNPYHLRVEFSKAKDNWTMSLVTAMSCLPREDSIQIGSDLTDPIE